MVAENTASTDGDDEIHHLVEDAQRGSLVAVEELLRRHLPELRAFVRLRTNSVIRARESCSDIVQSVCREALAHLESFEYRGEASFRNWLFTWAVNKIMNREKYHRAEKRSPAREAAVDPARDTSLIACYGTLCTPSREAVVHEELARMEDAFDRLPDHYREVILQSRLIGLPQAEIARQMGRSVESVKGLLKRALVRLTSEFDRMAG